jgi:phage baseplate assembly protein W
MSRATRAETLTSAKKIEYYSDFVTSFAKTPVGNQLSKVINDKSITQCLRNLIFTNLGERLFQPYIGSNINRMLFENNYPEDLDQIEFYVETTIKNNEPRVNLLEVNVSSGQSEHEIVIQIVYNTINNPEPINVEYIFKRVR